MHFKWFANIHTVMRRRAVVNPPTLLDTSSVTSPAQVSRDQEDQTAIEGEGDEVGGESQVVASSHTPSSIVSSHPTVADNQQPPPQPNVPTTTEQQLG